MPRPSWSRVLRAAGGRAAILWVGPMLAAALLAASGCRGDPGSVAVVAGKTVYRGMGVERVRVKAYRQRGETTESATASGYHGSFALRLPPGRYRLEARGTLPRGGETLLLEGSALLWVSPGTPRVDRVVVVLERRDAAVP